MPESVTNTVLSGRFLPVCVGWSCPNQLPIQYCLANFCLCVLVGRARISYQYSIVRQIFACVCWLVMPESVTNTVLPRKFLPVCVGWSHPNRLQIRQAMHKDNPSNIVLHFDQIKKLYKKPRYRHTQNVLLFDATYSCIAFTSLDVYDNVHGQLVRSAFKKYRQ